MSVNQTNFLPYILPMILCLAGFHGIFFYGNLARKTAAWAVFQLGLIFFLVQLSSAAGPLPRVLALEAATACLSVSILLAVFCLKMWKKHKTLEGGEIAKKVSK